MSIFMQTIQLDSTSPEVVLLQRCLQNCLSLEIGKRGIDGIFGPKTKVAVNQIKRENHLPEDGIVDANTWKMFCNEDCYYCSDLCWKGPAPPDAIAWGRMVSNNFKMKVIQISKDMRTNPDFIMSCMAYSTNMTFRTGITNPASETFGLIQFNEDKARILGTSAFMLRGIGDIDQLAYVQEYLSQYHRGNRGLADMYMAIFCPPSIGNS